MWVCLQTEIKLKMAASIHVKPKGTWKKVKIDFNLLSNTDLESLVSFEELTDYELVKEGVKSTNKKLKKVINLYVAPRLVINRCIGLICFCGNFYRD